MRRLAPAVLASLALAFEPAGREPGARRVELRLARPGVRCRVAVDSP